MQEIGEVEVSCCCRYQQDSPPAAAVIAVENGGEDEQPNTRTHAYTGEDPRVPVLVPRYKLQRPTGVLVSPDNFHGSSFGNLFGKCYLSDITFLVAVKAIERYVISGS
jgi:hypothetical protein